MSVAWKLDGIVKTYRRGSWLNPDLFTAVNRVSLSVAAGERVGIIGESGSGKSTLARVGLGLLPRDAGRVDVLGQDTETWNAQRWRTARRDVQLLFQSPSAMLNPAMTIGQLLQEGALLHRPDADADFEIKRVLEEVGLQGRELALPHELSGGEQRRAGVARLLLARPKLVVADEPTAGLDAALKASLVELLLDRIGKDCAFVLISHDLSLVTWATDRILVMSEGELVDSFRTKELGGVPHHERTVELLHAAGVA